jgi:hypothetical protein
VQARSCVPAIERYPGPPVQAGTVVEVTRQYSTKDMDRVFMLGEYFEYVIRRNID